MDAEYTFINPALSLLVTALAMRWNRPEEGGPWVWNTYQAYLKVRWEGGLQGCEWGLSNLTPLSVPVCSAGHSQTAGAGC